MAGRVGNPSHKTGRTHGGGTIKRVPASVQLLETRLQSYDEEIREQAWKGLDQLGAPDEPLVEKCEEQIHHQNWFVREAGVNALAFCVDAGCGMLSATTAEPLLEHEEPHIRYCAAQTLIGIEQRVRVKIVELNNPRDGKINYEKIEKATIPAQRAVEMLSQRLTHEDAKIRQNALDHLSRTGDLCTQFSEQICAMVTDPSLPVRNELLRVIARLGPLIVSGTAVLAQALEHEEMKMRRSGAKSLMELSHSCGPEVLEALMEPLVSEQRITRLASLDLIASLGHLAGPHGEEICDRLEETDSEVRLAAVHTLIACGRVMQPHHSHMKERTKHANPDIQRAAVQTLRGLAAVCPKFCKQAYKDMEEEPELWARKMAIEVIGGSGHYATSHLEEIAKALEDNDWGLKRCAIECLQDLKEHASPVAGEVAKRLLHHNPDVRRAAAEGLGRMGLHAGEFGHRVEGLCDTEEDEDVKRTCAAACEMLYAAGMHKNR